MSGGIDAALRRLTSARVGLGRCGSGQPTDAVLAFAMAHALARDAVRGALDADALAADVEALGHKTLRVASAAPDRRTFLLRPDLGRRLDSQGPETLRRAGVQDLVVVLADGLCSQAVQANAAPVLKALVPRLAPAGLSLGPVVIATQGRVALGDEIGERLGARAVLVLIGERPGLSSPDSLGAYLTFAPRVGRSDAERNCVSNIRPAGLSADAAAFKLGWLIAEAFRRRLTGVALKDESDLERLGGPAAVRMAPD